MLVTPDWQPRVFTESEIDEIEARRPCLATCEELFALFGRAISQMSLEEKRAYREAALEDLEKARRERDARLIAMPCNPKIQ